METPIADSNPDQENDNSISILDNLPPYQPAVPLPRRVKPRVDTIMSTVVPAKEGDATPNGCSGDPTNCSACRDSAFGRAFCSALGNSVCMLNPCPNCQSKDGTSTDKPQDMELDETSLPLTINPSLTQCCGNPTHCKGGACSPAIPDTSSARNKKRGKDISQEPINRCAKPRLPHLTIVNEDGDTVSCDVVWKALEAHPNAHLANPAAGPSHLANLNLLADVVARRSYCTLAPGEPTPEPEDFPRRTRRRPHPRTRDHSRSSKVSTTDVSTTGSHVDALVAIAYEEDQSMDVEMQSRMMVPKEVLQGHQRITTVPREGMRDAIALLDQQFGCS